MSRRRALSAVRWRSCTRAIRSRSMSRRAASISTSARQSSIADARPGSRRRRAIRAATAPYSPPISGRPMKAATSSSSPARARSPSRRFTEQFGDIGAQRLATNPARSQVESARWRYLHLRKRNAHEEERVAEKQVSFSADRRENQGARRLAGQDAQPAPYLSQESRSRSGRGVEVERGSGVVARWNDLHRRDVQERREDDLRQRGGSEGSFGPLQLQS